MKRPTYFVQECPTCGRKLEIKVEYLGKKLLCQHCRGKFVAQDPNISLAESIPTGGSSVLQRADELLRQLKLGELAPR